MNRKQFKAILNQKVPPALIGIIISAFFLFLFLFKVDYHKLWLAFKEVEYIYLLPLLILQVISYMVRALRWKYLMSSIKEIRFRSLFSATVVGFMANNLFPLRVGEFIRAYFIGTKENISKSASFATIILERLFDGFTILLFLLLVLFFLPLPTEGKYINSYTLKKIGIISLFLYLFIVIVLILLKKKPNLVTFFIKKI
ncbi:MAG: lysylphosphatidylglycerol synthase transmembrane domain-containing protein, partial [bacterium]